MSCDRDNEMKSIGKTCESNHRLIPDGGEENNDGENSGGENSDEEAENGETDNGDKGTTILYLDIGEGLFLDLFGVEVDLEEVELDVSAVPGSGKLLGNLLSAVASLLDDGLSDLLGNLLPSNGLPSLSDMLPDTEDISEMFFTVLNQILDALLEALDETDLTESADSSE